MPNLPQKKCACCGANLDRFIQPIILSILAKEPCNGYNVLKKIPEYATFNGSGADPTGVYRYLKIMYNKGLLKKSIGDGNDSSSIYSLTDEGFACLHNWMDTLKEYEQKIDRLLQELPIDRIKQKQP